jgi:hypothetical protein
MSFHAIITSYGLMSAFDADHDRTRSDIGKRHRQSGTVDDRWKTAQAEE